MSNIRLRYIRGWVDKKTGHVYRQFRRRGYKRVMLKGLPGSVEFRLAYEAALDAPMTAIGAGRTRPGTINDTLARYYDSHEFRTALAPATQKMRRAVLERFRNEHGDRFIAELPAKFVLLSLGPGTVCGAQLAEGVARAHPVRHRGRDVRARPDARHQAQEGQERRAPHLDRG